MRLIGDPQLQRSSMNSVAAPFRPTEDTQTDFRNDGSSYDSDAPRFTAASRPSASVFDGPVPSQARRKLYEVTMEQVEGNTNYAAQEPRYDLFDALNKHIEALDEQIETSSSFRGVLDEQFSSIEMQDGAGSYQFDDVQAGKPYSQSGHAFYDERSKFQAFSSANVAEPTRANVIGVDSFGFSTAHAKAAAEPEIPTMPSIIGQTDSFEFTTNQADLDESFEYSTNEADLNSSFQMLGAPNSQFTSAAPTIQYASSIQKRRGPPDLPDTDDPYALLGFSHFNPPKDAEDIRRAYVKKAKKYHPDAIHPKSNKQERELAALNFKRINDAYRKLKDNKFRSQNEFFAVTMGGAMYEPRGSSRHIRRPFSYGNDFDESGSIFSGSYSAKHGTKYGETRRFWEKRSPNSHDEVRRQQHRSSHGENNRRSPFRKRQEVRHNCHVSVEEFPPFFSH
jgi:curved DNA-binding protein CbpA